MMKKRSRHATYVFDEDAMNPLQQAMREERMQSGAQQFKSLAQESAGKLIKSSLLDSNRDEIKSIAGSVSGKSSMSVLTGKSKCGALNKHCTVEGCTSPLISLISQILY
jgi:hypothetical protein